MMSPQRYVFVFPRKCLCFLEEMCSSPRGNYGFSLTRCDCLLGAIMVSPQRDVIVSLRKMKLYTLFLGRCIHGIPSPGLTPTLGTSWGHQLMGFCLLFATLN
jgi:hypothetical protein